MRSCQTNFHLKVLFATIASHSPARFLLDAECDGILLPHAAYECPFLSDRRRNGKANGRERQRSIEGNWHSAE
jgi:hypothetical protein